MTNRLHILFENNNCLVVDKPAGMLSVPDRYDATIPNIKHYAKSVLKGALMVHRLDKDTSGALLLAKNAESHKYLQTQFEQRRIEKNYIAIIHGTLKQKSGIVLAGITKKESSKGIMKISKAGKSSETSYACIERFKHYEYLKLHPKTGRTHQIRVHMAHLGHPIICDPLYGNGKPLLLSSIKRNYKLRKGQIERPLMMRTALHASFLSFELNDERIEVACDIPKDFRATLNQLRKYG